MKRLRHLASASWRRSCSLLRVLPSPRTLTPIARYPDAVAGVQLHEAVREDVGFARVRGHQTSSASTTSGIGNRPASTVAACTAAAAAVLAAKASIVLVATPMSAVEPSGVCQKVRAFSAFERSLSGADRIGSGDVWCLVAPKP